ncbi:hypothetical protein J4E83_005318 [Alternaria metachromatica]|uniref:uncharacterized protein n=1 Tax=Alternaria metachromatica TaxID=283354 RepID=UPI0020C2F13E|nr:uncharacterized protein J4E83_005318 [Alternaria metachromatica]KAI4620955.1 hypothetical protein J4E83_005318 [Alternaria metachromatica]
MLLSGYVAGEDGTTNSTDEVLLVRMIPFADLNTKEPSYGTGSFAFKDIRYPIADGLIASASNGVDSVYRNEPPVVHECMLSWCVRRVRSSYEWGVYSESTEETFLNIATEPDPWPWTVIDDFFTYWPNITLEAPAVDFPDTNVTYSVWNDTAFQIMVVWDDFFPSFYTATDRDSEPVLRFKDYPNGPTTRSIDSNPWLAPKNVTRHMEGLASALTNVMRSNSKTTEALLGEAYNQEKFVHINWPWLIFPLLLLLLSLVFLVATIIKTSNDTDTGFWKTSAMPTLMYGLPQDMRKDSISTTSSDGTPHHDPRKVRIRLLPKQGWRVSGQVQPAPTAPPGFI